MSKKKKNKQKCLLFQTGVTPENESVMGGCFSFYETYGLPLSVIFISFQEKDCIPDWVDFYLAALTAGMEHSRILSKLEEAICDSFGKEICNVVINRLDQSFKERK